jgi:hypothetical protein
MTPRKTFPILPAVEKDTVVIWADKKIDKQGRQSFSAMWHVEQRLWDNHGVLFTEERPDTTGGTRGQMFYADLTEFVEKHKVKGKKIILDGKVIK